MLDAARTRRADRFLDLLLGGLPAVELGCITRDVERLDGQEPLLEGEIALGNELNTLYIAVLLRRRGFARTGWNGKSGVHREPVYTRAD